MSTPTTFCNENFWFAALVTHTENERGHVDDVDARLEYWEGWHLRNSFYNQPKDSVLGRSQQNKKKKGNSQ